MAIDYGRLAEISAQIRVWADRNFPNGDPEQAAIGVVEEVGELTEVVVAASAIEETWLPVPDYEGWYDVSYIGNIRRVAGGKGAHPERNRRLNVRYDGYLSVNLSRGSKEYIRVYLVHRLVAAAFIGPCPDGFEVNHRDGDKQNNCAANLEYLTPSDNQRHAISIGLKVPKKGEDHPMALLNWDEVREIRRAYAVGNVSLNQLANRFAVSKRTIHFIVQHKTWREADAEIAEETTTVEADSKVFLQTVLETGQSDHGVMVAVGRLAHATLKKIQGIRGSAEKHDADTRDALADAMVYLLDFCGRSGVLIPKKSADLEIAKDEVVDETWLLSRLATAAGQLLSFARLIRGKKYNPPDYGIGLAITVEYIFTFVDMFAALRGWSTMDLLEETWARVSKRDWTKDKVHGGELQSLPSRSL